MPKLKTTYQNLHPFILDNLITEFQLGLGDKMWSDIGFGGTDLKKATIDTPIMKGMTFDDEGSGGGQWELTGTGIASMKLIEITLSNRGPAYQGSGVGRVYKNNGKWVLVNKKKPTSVTHILDKYFFDFFEGEETKIQRAAEEIYQSLSKALRGLLLREGQPVDENEDWSITLEPDPSKPLKTRDKNPIQLDEKKIGFNRGPEYSEETEELLSDFSKSTEMINKELEKKIIDSDDPKVQEILNILDDRINSEFIDDLETVYNLIQDLPDKPTEPSKVGFRQAANELYMYNKTK